MHLGSEETASTTAWAAFAGALAEGGWLAAVLLVATFFNTDTARIFEEEKIFLFRSVALVIALALAVWMLEGRRWASLRSEWRRPLVKPVVALGAVCLISVPFSIAPRVSFWGSYDRVQGAYTWICYIVVFLAMVAIVRRRAQVERLLATILLASLPLALYGVIQRLGTDPIEWVAESFPRVHSMAGNSIFLGALLIMVIPLTLSRVIDCLMRPRRGQLARRVPLIFAYLALLFLQVLAVVYSESRGPFLGLCAGLAVFLLAFAACTGRRWIGVVAATTSAAGLGFLVVFNLPQSPLAPLRNVEYIGRLGQLGIGAWSSARVRVLVWESVFDLLAAEPGRLVLGYGPDTLRFAFPRVRPEEMSYHDRRNVVADRSHNDTLDALVMMGIAGLVAELILFVSILFWLTRWLGLVHSPPQRNSFFCLLLGGGLTGFGGVLVLDGSLRFAGVALPLGMIAGLFVYLFVATIRGFSATRCPVSDRLLLMALLAAVVAHLVEIQFGIAVAVTHLLFFVCAAVAVLLGGWPNHHEEEPANSPLVGGSLAPLAPLVGLTLVLLTYDFYRVDLDLQHHGPALSLLFGTVWIFGAIIVGFDSRQRGGTFARVVSFATTSLGTWILFLAVYLPRAPSRSMSTVAQTAPQVIAAASRPTQAVTILYAFVLGVLLFYACLTYLRERPTSGPARAKPARALLYAAGLIGVVAIAVNTNLRKSWAGVPAAQAVGYEASGAWHAAALAYAEAERRDPVEDIYASQLGFTLLEQAKHSGPTDWQRCHAFLRESRAALLRARRMNPANLDHARNLAKLHQIWSTFDPDPERARRHLESAESIFRDLAVAMPSNAGLMNEWATLYLDHGDLQTALARLDDSLRIDGSYYTTHWLRGNVLMELGAFEPALAAYERTLQLAPHLPAAMSAKALALAALGRLDEAIHVSQQAVDYNGADLISRRNLIALLQRTGNRDRALEQARAALPHASGDEAIQFRELIAQLESGTGAQRPDAGSPSP